MPRPRTIDLRWNAIFNDFRRSGLTQAEFCRRRDISLHSFRKRLYSPRPSRDRRPSGAPDQPFLQVTILPDHTAPATAPPSHLELVLNDGRRIAVPPGFDAQTLRQLLAALEGSPCSG